MKKHCILIVDDQREVRRVLRAGLETLGKDFEIVDVPSAEEAMLVITQQPLEILVSDVRLPGISGLELKRWAKIRNPNLKLILVTGLVDPQVREEVMNAGADAFFFKPVEMGDFLETVERCLGLADSGASLDVAQPPEQSLGERISGLRRELDLTAVVLLDDRGRVLARAGNLHDPSAETGLVPALMTVRSAGGKVAHALGKRSAQNLMYFAGPQSGVYLADVGPNMAICLEAPSEVTADGKSFARVLAALRPAVQDLLVILANMGVSTQPSEPVQDRPQTSSAVDETVPALAPDLEAIFQQQGQPRQEEADAFWEALAGEGDANLLNADVLSFEQARRLGLAPTQE
ncbi:MAG TPA: response regulator [Anaerolineales bacterium]